jgi:hypothetical protein
MMMTIRMVLVRSKLYCEEVVMGKGKEKGKGKGIPKAVMIATPTLEE